MLISSERCVALGEQDVDMESIVVDQSDGPETSDVLEKIPNGGGLVYVRSQTRGLGAATEEGIEYTRSPYIVHTDDDCEASPGWVAGMAEALRSRPNIALVFCNVIAAPSDTRWIYTPNYHQDDNRLSRSVFSTCRGPGLISTRRRRRSRLMERADVVVIGAGIVGLATARAVLRAHPSATVVVLDKEGVVSGHQSGRNSGVIHAGVYYQADSYKARLCTAGRVSMLAFCRDQGISHEVRGKLVIAVDETERDRLVDLKRRCQANGVRVEPIGREELRHFEPHAAGVAALHVPDTGVVDYADVSRALARDITRLHGMVRLETAVVSGSERVEGLVLETTRDPIAAQRVVACCGLHADTLAHAVSGPGADGGLRVVPFRGEYYELAPARSHLVRALIYPVPDPQFPFLGVHLTRGITGHVHLGPNAVLALAREGYSWRHVDMADLLRTVKSPGFRRLARKHWRYGLDEMTRSFSRRRFTRALQRLLPEITEGDLEPAPAGVRAQAIAADGSLVDDFAFKLTGRAFHLLNAPSPAATASLEIGAMISRHVEFDT